MGVWGMKIGQRGKKEEEEEGLKNGQLESKKEGL